MRLSDSQAAVLRALGPLDGQKVDGGCVACDAYQMVTAASPGVWNLTVYHDDDCPVLAAREARRRS